MKLLITKVAARQLIRVPASFRSKIKVKIRSLQRSPFPIGYKKLAGRQGYRLRIGDYRVIYHFSPREKLVIVLSVQHRKDAYRYS